MSISYSGIVGYGKVTLPSVESWNTNTNIVRDPPKSITTRKIDKVGDTSLIANTLSESGDRLCEYISYYPKGVNPSVSVSYNNRGSKQAFLPYRIMRDGAFRPPIRTQEELLPLSRMPRIWMTVDTQPYAPDFSKRILNCGTADNTREVKNSILKKSCETRKTFGLEPGVNEPRIVGMISSTLTPGQVDSCRSNVEGGHTENAIRELLKNIKLVRNHPVASGFSNKRGEANSSFVPKINLNAPKPCGINILTNASTSYQNKPLTVPNILLENNRPVFENYTTNTKFIKEKPVVATFHLTNNRPHAEGMTNIKLPGSAQVFQPKTTLRDKIQPDPAGANASIPRTTTIVPVKNLIRVR